MAIRKKKKTMGENYFLFRKDSVRYDPRKNAFVALVFIYNLIKFMSHLWLGFNKYLQGKSLTCICYSIKQNSLFAFYSYSIYHYFDGFI